MLPDGGGVATVASVFPDYADTWVYFEENRPPVRLRHPVYLAA